MNYKINNLIKIYLKRIVNYRIYKQFQSKMNYNNNKKKQNKMN